MQQILGIIKDGETQQDLLIHIPRMDTIEDLPRILKHSGGGHLGVHLETPKFTHYLQVLANIL